MPGASLMILISGPSIPLVISVSAPARNTSARPCEPDPAIALENPAEIDSTETNTTTTPAIPMMATAEEPSLCGIVRRLRDNTATVCLSHLTAFLLIPSQSVCNSQTHGSQRRHDTRHQAHQYHEPDANDDVAKRQRVDCQ